MCVCEGERGRKREGREEGEHGRTGGAGLCRTGITKGAADDAVGVDILGDEERGEEQEG